MTRDDVDSVFVQAVIPGATQGKQMYLSPVLLPLTSINWLLQASYSAKYLREMIDLTDDLNPHRRKANSGLQDHKRPAGRDDYVKYEVHRNSRKERSEASRVSGLHGKLGST